MSMSSVPCSSAAFCIFRDVIDILVPRSHIECLVLSAWEAPERLLVLFLIPRPIGSVLSMNTWSNKKDDPIAQDLSDIEKVLGWP